MKIVILLTQYLKNYTISAKHKSSINYKIELHKKQVIDITTYGSKFNKFSHFFPFINVHF